MYIKAMIEPYLAPDGWRSEGDGWSGRDFETRWTRDLKLGHRRHKVGKNPLRGHHLPCMRASSYGKSELPAMFWAKTANRTPAARSYISVAITWKKGWASARFWLFVE